MSSRPIADEDHVREDVPETVATPVNRREGPLTEHIYDFSCFDRRLHERRIGVLSLALSVSDALCEILYSGCGDRWRRSLAWFSADSQVPIPLADASSRPSLVALAMSSAASREIAVVVHHFNIASARAKRSGRHPGTTKERLADRRSLTSATGVGRSSKQKPSLGKLHRFGCHRPHESAKAKVTV